MATPDNAEDWLKVKPLRDPSGHLIPSVIWPEFEYAKHIAKLAGALMQCATTIDMVLQTARGTDYVDRKKFVDLIEEAHSLLVESRPMEVCLPCYNAGKGFRTACACKGLGWLPVLAATHKQTRESLQSRKRERAKRRKKTEEYLSKLKAFLAKGDFSRKAIHSLPKHVQWIPRALAVSQGSSVLDLPGFRRPSRRRHKPAPPKSPPTSP